MPEYNPDSSAGKVKSAPTFVARLRALQRHYAWEDFVLLEAAQQKLGGPAKLWLDESPRVYNTFAEFETELLAAFPSYTTTADVLEEVLAQRRGPSEGLEEFSRRMMVLGRRADIPDDDLAQYIIKRLNHVQFLTSIGCVRIRSVAELLQAVAYFGQKIPHSTHSVSNNISSTQYSEYKQQHEIPEKDDGEHIVIKNVEGDVESG